MIKEYRIRTYRCVLYCDECESKMRYWGPVQLDGEEKFRHKCPKCNSVQNMDDQYPCEMRREELEINVRD